MNTVKNVACLANALGLLCFWPYVAAVLLAVPIGRRPEAFITRAPNASTSIFPRGRAAEKSGNDSLKACNPCCPLIFQL